MRCLAPSLALLAAAWLARNGEARAEPGSAAGNPATSGNAAISIEGACPDGRAVERAIDALIPRGTAALPESARVTIEDDGDSYRVEVRSADAARSRLFRDASRDCEQRARFAAVFIVLTLLPPDLAIPAPPPRLPPLAPAAPPPPAPIAASPAPAAPPRWRLEIAALGEAAPQAFASTSAWALGGELSASYGSGSIAGALSAGLEPRIDFSIGGLQVRELRVPIGAGARLQRVVHGLELAGELALVLAPFHAEGLNSAMPASGTRLDLGARGGVRIRLGTPRRRLAPFVGLQVSVFPWPYEIAAAPAGGLGTTPPLWLGATIGVSAAR